MSCLADSDERRVRGWWVVVVTDTGRVGLCSEIWEMLDVVLAPVTPVRGIGTGEVTDCAGGMARVGAGVGTVWLRTLEWLLVDTMRGLGMGRILAGFSIYIVRSTVAMMVLLKGVRAKVDSRRVLLHRRRRAALSARIRRRNTPVVQFQSQVIKRVLLKSRPESRRICTIAELSPDPKPLLIHGQVPITSCLTERRILPRHAARTLPTSKNKPKTERLRPRWGWCYGNLRDRVRKVTRIREMERVHLQI